MDPYELNGLLHHLETHGKRPPFKPIRSALVIGASQDDVLSRIEQALPDATVVDSSNNSREKFDFVFVDDACPHWEWVREKANLMVAFHGVADEAKLFWDALSALCPYPTTVINCQEEGKGGIGIVYLEGIGVHHGF